MIHDYFCETHTETWQNIHMVFYNGMRARGVDTIKAKIMYAAVYNFGPRWLEVKDAQADKSHALISGRPLFLEQTKDAIIKFVSAKILRWP